MLKFFGPAATVALLLAACAAPPAATAKAKPAATAKARPAATAKAKPVTHTATCLALVPAAYGNSVWKEISSPHKAPADVIADWGGTTNNPTSGGGPGGSFSQASDNDIKGAQANGVTVLGYVWTDAANSSKSGPPASVSEIEAQVKAWKTWYGISDIFFDEASTANSTTDLRFYSTIYKYVHSLSTSAVVWINPGTYPQTSKYMSDADVVLDWEDTVLPKTPPSWVLSYPASRFANFVHGYSGSVAKALKAIKNDHAANAYVTENYNSVPPYWSSEQSAACAA